MLYDNALLSRAYLNAYLLTGDPSFRDVCLETLDYVLREMTSPEGGFYSSQDADSEGREGAFFLWTLEEIRAVLGEPDSDLFCGFYGVTAEGNFEEQNILNVPASAEEYARLNGIPPESLQKKIAAGKKLLFAAREQRIRPGRDEKILTAWNGLMLRSFAEAAVSLDREDYRRAAERNAEFLLSRLRPEGNLRRSHKDGRARFNAYLEDYACLIDGLLAVYEATFNPRWIQQARQLAEEMIGKFWDENDGCFYFTAGDHETLIHRPKEVFDHATPSGNSVAADALLRLWKVTGDEKWSGYPLALLKNLADPMTNYPSAFAHLLGALDFYLGRPKEIAIVGDPGDSRTRELLKVIFGRYLPNRVVVCGEENGPLLLAGKRRLDDRPTVYVCENFSCRTPVNTPEDLAEQLMNSRQA
jgi:uncharacterized protein YyaL (SSP411 family)